MGKRKSYSASFKSKVALEAIQGDMTIAELASQVRAQSQYDHQVEEAGSGRHEGDLLSWRPYCPGGHGSCPDQGASRQDRGVDRGAGFFSQSLAAVMDWYSRRVLSWRVSNTLEADFCVAALEDAIDAYGPPEIFNTDQGSQFTSLAFTGLLKDKGVRISMDGRGAWMDNVFIERLWWSLKYECVYLNEFENGKALRKGLGAWIDFYNTRRGHSSLDHRTPDQAYFQGDQMAA